MKHIISIWSLLVTLILMVTLGCAGYNLPTTKGYSELCQSYVGGDIKKLTDEWGYRGRTIRAPDGNRVYVYVDVKDAFVINPLDHPSLIVYPRPVDFQEMTGNVLGRYYVAMGYCITYFEIDKDNKITQVIWEGDCKALERSKEAK